ncbi:MAG: DUF1003 domain-containing protein [Galactobacter sp.]
MSLRQRRVPRLMPNPDGFGSATERFARFMGTPQFLLWMTIFCALWLAWNTVAPLGWRFDSAAFGFTALTLVLSLQASYAAPLLLLAQNRQDDRDRVSLTEDRARAERNLTDTEYLTREIAGLRLAMRDVATRDFVRSELRNVLEELLEEQEGVSDAAAARRRERERGKFERDKEREEKEREEREQR